MISFKSLKNIEKNYYCSLFCTITNKPVPPTIFDVWHDTILIKRVHECLERDKAEDIITICDRLITKQLDVNGYSRSAILDNIVEALTYFTNEGIETKGNFFTILYPVSFMRSFLELNQPVNFPEALTLKLTQAYFNFYPCIFDNVWYIFEENRQISKGVKFS